MNTNIKPMAKPEWQILDNIDITLLIRSIDSIIKKANLCFQSLLKHM